MRIGTILSALVGTALAAWAAEPVKVNWLTGTAPAISQGVSWGIPWPRGAVRRDSTFKLTDANGHSVPVQSWPMGYWPDGSLKWTGHAAGAVARADGPFTISEGSPATPSQPLKAAQSSKLIEVRNGATLYRISRSGSSLIESISVDGREVAREGKLIAIREDRSEYASKKILREEEFKSRIDAAAVEQSGPVRAVIKLTGRHKSDSGSRSWLPFTVRLSFFAGTGDVRMVHSFVFDGDQEKDFIRGLGIRFTVPMREELQNRHVRFGGAGTGLFAEPARAVAGNRVRSPELYAQQLAGRPVPTLEQLPWKEYIPELPTWNDFRLTQTSPDAFAIEKRTSPRSAWIRAVGGGRASGLAFAGDTTTGGLAVAMRNFWRLAPTALEVHGLGQSSAELTVWLWSPEAPAMDLRAYDDKGHAGEATYEDWEPGFSNATGVARTSELTLRAYSEVPRNDELLEAARAAGDPAQLVCAPEYYHAAGAFGVWSLPDRSSPAKARLETKLDQAFAFYQGQVEQRGWYGFWDYGDVMHSYDNYRHTWKYDLGGFAWHNTELMPDMWLWYAFLRSGRADVFRMAEAMTRHTQEVDVYHLGRFQGLGSRHNVRHWGCSAKEMRISQAALKRFYYYLTTDSRTGDLMDEVVDADERLLTIDPVRKIEPKTTYPTHIRVGPDWMAAASNWFTAWERTGDTRYRDRILTGMKALSGMKWKLFSGRTYGYDPKTKMIYQLYEQPAINGFVSLMGGPEVFMELNPVIELPEWNDLWLHMCRYAQAPPEELAASLGAPSRGVGMGSARLTAYAAHALKDPRLAAKAWKTILSERLQFVPEHYSGSDVAKPIDEATGVSTGGTAQWCLNIIEMLELVGEYLPKE